MKFALPACFGLPGVALPMLLAWSILAPAWAGETLSPGPAWTSGGVPVASGDRAQTNPIVASDGAGGAIMVWEEEWRVCVQHLTSSGLPAPGWSPQGLLVSNAQGPSIASDGAGGAFLAWTWVGPGLIGLQHIVGGAPFGTAEPAAAAAFGAVPPTIEPAASEPPSLLKAPRNALSIVLPDGTGGTLLAWKRMSLSADKLMFQRLDRDGAPATGWIRPTGVGLSDSDPSICSDDSAGAIFAWMSWVGTDADIFAQRIRSDGSIAPGWPALDWPAIGFPVCTEPGAQRATGVVPDGVGGAIVVWQDMRNGTFEQVFAQRVTREGAIAAGWPGGGRPVCIYPTESGLERFNGQYWERFSSVATDGAGGVWIVWVDKRADAGDVYCQHLLPDGSLAAGSPENGVALCAAPGLQSAPAIVADGQGGAIACWQDARAGEADVYAQRVAGDGAPAEGWPKNGLAVCVESGDQLTPRIVSDGASGAIIAWQDGRSGNPEIYAARVTGDGVVPALASLVSAEGRPGLARIVWFTPERLDFRATVYRRQAASDWAPLDPVIPDGSGLITYEDREVAAGHRYGYRLGIAEGGVQRFLGEVWLEIANSPGLALLVPYPNPSPGGVQVPFALPGGGRGALELLDLSGRAIETHPLEGLGAGAHVALVAASRPLPPGIYCVRLTYAGRSLSARVAIVR